MKISTGMLLIVQLVMGATFCNSDSSVCILSSQKDSSTTCFTIHSKYTGWTALGIGSSQMAGSDMYIGWSNNQGGFTIANFKGTGRTRPALNDVQNAQSAALIERPSKADLKTAFSFCRPTTVRSGAPITETQSYIWAASDSSPTGNVATTSASFSVHSTYGSFKANFLAGNQTVASGDTAGSSILKTNSSFTYQDAVNFHGSLMWIAWVLSPIVGIFIARYGKDALGHNWYRLHLGIMGITTGLASIAGVTLMILYSPPPYLGSIHGIAGAAITVLMIIQIILGFVSNAMFKPDRKKIPTVDKAHWWLGRLLVLAGIANCQLGFMIYSASFTLSNVFVITHWTIVGGAALMFVIAEIKVGQVNHVGHSKNDHEQGSKY